MKTNLSAVVSTVTTGQIMSRVTCREDEGPGANIVEAEVLNPGAISGGIIHHENIGTVLLKKAVQQSRITLAGDIVIKLSSPYDCARITEDDEGLIVPSFCGILRGINADIIDPYFLLGYLNSDFARRELLLGVSASAMSMVRAKALQDLEIPILPLEEQQIVGAAYWQSCRRKATLERLARKQQDISDAVIAEAVLEAQKT